MTIEELKATMAKEGEEEFEADDGTMEQDILTAIDLLRSLMHLLDYFGDPELKVAVAKKEREIFIRESDKIKSFLDEAIPVYVDEAEEKE